jgi:hypothetical protein
VTVEGPELPVAVDVVFERFPASVRGAVVVRGTDSEPHQIRLDALSVTEAHATSRVVHEVPAGPVTVDVVPRGEILIPFDVPFAELAPGWYGVVSAVVVDGQRRIQGPDEVKRFVVPWPPEEVRRGSIPADLPIRVPGSRGAVVERVDCKPDRAIVRWRHAPGERAAEPEFPDLRVFAGSRRLPNVDSGGDPGTGERITVTHPVLKRHRQLTFEIDRRVRYGRPAVRGKWSASLDLP